MVVTVEVEMVVATEEGQGVAEEGQMEAVRVGAMEEVPEEGKEGAAEVKMEAVTVVVRVEEPEEATAA